MKTQADNQMISSILRKVNPYRPKRLHFGIFRCAVCDSPASKTEGGESNFDGRNCLDRGDKYYRGISTLGVKGHRIY